MQGNQCDLPNLRLAAIKKIYNYHLKFNYQINSFIHDSFRELETCELCTSFCEDPGHGNGKNMLKFSNVGSVEEIWKG